MSPTSNVAHANPLRDPRDRRLPRIAGPCGLVIFAWSATASRVAPGIVLTTPDATSSST